MNKVWIRCFAIAALTNAISFAADEVTPSWSYRSADDAECVFSTPLFLNGHLWVTEYLSREGEKVSLNVLRFSEGGSVEERILIHQWESENRASTEAAVGLIAVSDKTLVALIRPEWTWEELVVVDLNEQTVVNRLHSMNFNVSAEGIAQVGEDKFLVYGARDGVYKAKCMRTSGETLWEQAFRDWPAAEVCQIVDATMMDEHSIAMVAWGRPLDKVGLAPGTVTLTVLNADNGDVRHIVNLEGRRPQIAFSKGNLFVLRDVAKDGKSDLRLSLYSGPLERTWEITPTLPAVAGLLPVQLSASDERCFLSVKRPDKKLFIQSFSKQSELETDVFIKCEESSMLHDQTAVGNDLYGTYINSEVVRRNDASAHLKQKGVTFKVQLVD